MKKGSPDRLTRAQRAEIEALAALPDDQIDTRDMPEVRDWSSARPVFSAHQAANHAAD
jgi:hypothetical protein